MKEILAHFCTPWQAVIFRNYGKVPVARIAAVLKTTEENIRDAASDLGLGAFSYMPEWDKKGYLTTVRNNWRLLSVPQLLTLLNITEQRFNGMLRDEDFLRAKLGAKPRVEEPVYGRLSVADAAQTQDIRRLVEQNITPRKERYFDFYGKLHPRAAARGAGGAEPLRIVHNYCASDPDFLLTGDFSEYPPEYLNELRKCGVNGLWFHGLLNKFATQIPDSVSDGQYGTRLKQLKAFTEHLAAFGIKAFIYLNEPRSLCTSRPDVKQYLYDTIKNIVTAVPDLGGFITITMSENETNCYSRAYTDKKQTACPLCAKRTPDDVVAEINNIFYRAMLDAQSDARLIAWNWGWSDFCGWTEAEQKGAVEKLDKGIDVMCVSEEALEIEKGGVKNRIIDYSVSNPGPSPRTKKIWNIAVNTGHKIIAKIQAANSWECAAVPYLPVFDLLNKHLTDTAAVGIRDFMLGWTLGGWPSPILKFVKAFFDGKSLNDFYGAEYDENAANVKAACERFSKSFSEFPFCLDFVYNGPQNFGCANLFFKEPTGLKSSMLGYPFDDIDGWRGNYPPEILLSQLKKLSDGWQDGMQILETLGGDNPVNELKTVAGAAGCHFTSAYLLTAWVLDKDKALLEKEYENTQKLLQYSALDARIGFEASNHYLYNENNLLEKLINLKYLMKLQIE
jgi:hypothetical protein